MHGTDGDNEERQERHQCGEAAEEHRPANLPECLDHGLAPLAVNAHTSAEIREDVDVIGNGHGKGQNGRNHQYGGVNIHLRPARNAVGDKESANHRDNRRQHTTQRACHAEHHQHADDGGNHHQSTHLLSDINGLAVGDVGHARTFRMQ